MKVYLAGSGGMLGEALHRVLGEKHELRCTDVDLNAPWLDYCDFRDFHGYAASVSQFSPDILMHIGAHTDLEYCENNPDDAYTTNTISVENAKVLAQAHGIPLVYISTAGIFDGQKMSYDDWDTPNPLGVYARTKYLGEKIVTQHPQHFIFRAGWMMGGGPSKDKKFINKLIKQIDSGAKVLRVVDDRLGTPTYTVDFARNLQTVIDTKFYGLYNMVCGGATGRLEVARELLSILQMDKTIGIEAVSSTHFATEYFAPRPPSERLVNYRLKLRGLDQMRDWRAALLEYVSEYFSDHVKPDGQNYTK